jgi:hypothetical protein
MIVKPETFVAWHRKGVRLFWTLENRPRGKPPRPSVPLGVPDLIRVMSRNDSFWGAPRIHGELLKLGIDISEPTVAKHRGANFWNSTARPRSDRASREFRGRRRSRAALNKETPLCCAIVFLNLMPPCSPTDTRDAVRRGRPWL